MKQESALIGQRMRTPRAAAIAGILFSLLLIASMLLIRISIPANPLGPATDVINHSKAISLALHLLPFAGIAFLWFIAVVRDRLGELEDRFFATVFLGSGLLFIAMVFTSAAIAGGIITVLSSGSGNLIQSGAYALGRVVSYQVMHVYATKMAGVFMISTSTLALRTRIVPRWMAFLGYTLALILLLSVDSVEWASVVFPLWVLLISVHILLANLQPQPASDL
jgi:hypothetical protein